MLIGWTNVGNQRCHNVRLFIRFMKDQPWIYALVKRWCSVLPTSEIIHQANVSLTIAQL